MPPKWFSASKLGYETTYVRLVTWHRRISDNSTWILINKSRIREYCNVSQLFLINSNIAAHYLPSTENWRYPCCNTNKNKHSLSCASNGVVTYHRRIFPVRPQTHTFWCQLSLTGTTKELKNPRRFKVMVKYCYKFAMEIYYKRLISDWYLPGPHLISYFGFDIEVCLYSLGIFW